MHHFSRKIDDSRKFQSFDLLTVFWNFLANYPAKSDIIGLIETTASLKPCFLIGYAKFVF